ncbi:MAG: FG-GAP-like repeat-containing protein [Deltaproteobacteria bacterium]
MWMQNFFKSMKPKSACRRPLARPLLEPLENRCLLSFGLAANYDVGSGPRSVAAGDFNGDGKPDLAAAAELGIAVLLNNGDGSMANEVIYPLGEMPLTVVAADLNRDGILDLAVTTSVGHAKVLLGNGAGVFASSSLAYDLGAGRAMDSVLGDFNEDGNLDLIVSNLDGDAGILLGNGDGTFAARQGLAVGVATRDVDVADLNSDGHLDLIAGSAFNNYVRVLLGDGDGTFQPAQTAATFTVGGLPAEVVAQAVGDVNGDGVPDLVAASQQVWGGSTGYDEYTWVESYIRADLGNGDGTFSPGTTYSIGLGSAQAVELADFDGDNQLDIVAGGAFTGNVILLHGNGDGKFGIPEPSPEGSVRGAPDNIAVSDLDGNGALDIATANFGWNTVSVLLNGVSQLPTLSIGDASAGEGNSGTTSIAFTVTLSAALAQPVAVSFSTSGGTAAAGRDYQSTSGTLTFAPGETSKTITVLVNGDRIAEPNETFFVNLSNPTNATIADGQGIGTILDDEPRISISDVSKKEGSGKKTTLFTFTITLSAAYDQAVTMSYKTTDGTATTGDKDYVAKTGTITFNPGETSKTITIIVNGDRKKESNETFYLDLFGNSSNSLFTKSRGVGTILNDD